MLSLAFDTSTLWGRFALARDADLLIYQPHNVSGSYADALLTVIDDILKRSDLSLSQLDAIGICRGPGSFTGLRIGVAMAKGLAWSLGVPLIAVSTLEAMATAMLAERPDAEFAVPVLDARRNEIFAGIYRRRGGWVEELAVPRALPPDRWWETVLETISDPGAPVYAGNGAELMLGEGETLRPQLLESGKPRIRHWSAAHPATASALALAITDPGIDLQPSHPFSLAPLYLRASEAEVKRGLDLTPSGPAAEMEIRRAGRDPETGAQR